MAGVAADPPGAHEHTDECRRLYVEWRRYDAVVVDASQRFTAGQVQEALREREMFERQLHAVDCSSEAVRHDDGGLGVADGGRLLL